jgi:uncharacterized protein YfaT (DUF1175 family)
VPPESQYRGAAYPAQLQRDCSGVSRFAVVFALRARKQVKAARRVP